MKELLTEVTRICGKRGLTLQMEWDETGGWEAWAGATDDDDFTQYTAGGYSEPENALNALLRAIERDRK
jgi:hypothetical protein